MNTSTSSSKALKQKGSQVNLNSASTLYFQIGLIISLLMAYFALEYAIVIPKPELSALSPTADLYEKAPESFKVYQEPLPIVEPEPKLKNKVLNPTLTTIEDQSPEKETGIIDESFTDPQPNLNPNDIAVYHVPTDVVIDEAFVQRVPVFPGCERETTNESRKKCFSTKLQKLIQKNFNTDIAQQYGLTGKQNIGVQFEIDTNGNVTQIKARAPHPELQKEAIRVLNKIPTMQPGQQNNNKVTVRYALPIKFEIHH